MITGERDLKETQPISLN